MPSTHKRSKNPPDALLNTTPPHATPPPGLRTQRINLQTAIVLICDLDMGFRGIDFDSKMYPNFELTENSQHQDEVDAPHVCIELTLPSVLVLGHLIGSDPRPDCMDDGKPLMDDR